MTWIDWLIFGVYLAGVVLFGIVQSRKSSGIEGYFLAGRTLPWGTIGLSVMATQASAITFIVTTGQAYDEGMEFIQIYLAHPFAIVVICILFVPFFYRAKVYTAYEFLERRYDAKTRSLTSFLFLLSRGLATGIVMYAPAVVLSILMGWDETITILVIGGITILYTVVGGITAVVWTDVLQMILMFAGDRSCAARALPGAPIAGRGRRRRLHRGDPPDVEEHRLVLGSNQRLHSVVGTHRRLFSCSGLLRL